MPMPNGYYPIYHPPHKIPGVFDLHKRGRFKDRPFVTRDWDYRVIADLDGKAALFVAQLVEEDNMDPDTRIPYRFRVRETLLDLDENLAFKPEALAACMPDTGIQESLTAAYTEWRNAYVPVTEDNQTDVPALEQKVRAAAADGRNSHCKQIAARNQGWVMAAIPRLIQDFRFGLYDLAGRQLAEQYQTRGGDADDLELMRKMSLFYRIYDHEGDDRLQKPDGGFWADENDIWDCWVGFAGSETEAQRMCDVMETVFRPLHQELAA